MDEKRLRQAPRVSHDTREKNDARKMPLSDFSCLEREGRGQGFIHPMRIFPRRCPKHEAEKVAPHRRRGRGAVLIKTHAHGQIMTTTTHQHLPTNGGTELDTPRFSPAQGLLAFHKGGGTKSYKLVTLALPPRQKTDSPFGNPGIYTHTYI